MENYYFVYIGKFVLLFLLIVVWMLPAFNRRNVNRCIRQVQNEIGSDGIRFAGKKGIYSFVLDSSICFSMALFTLWAVGTWHSILWFYVFGGLGNTWWWYRKTPLCVLTDNFVYVFLYYGCSLSYSRYEWGQLRWRGEKIWHWRRYPRQLILVCGNKEIGDVDEYAKGAEKFVRERVKQMEPPEPPVRIPFTP